MPSRAWARPKKLTDAELICLAVAQVLLGFRSQHHWLRFCRRRLGAMLRYLPKQPGYNKRVNAAGPLIAKTIQQLAVQVSTRNDRFRFLDATPIPCSTSVPPADDPSWPGSPTTATALHCHAGTGESSYI
uniref:hypothetical protein n=1 Tax=Nocardia amamiensis TaxID=404578 RepID=UPI000A6A4428